MSSNHLFDYTWKTSENTPRINHIKVFRTAHPHERHIRRPVEFISSYENQRSPGLLEKNLERIILIIGDGKGRLFQTGNFVAADAIPNNPLIAEGAIVDNVLQPNVK